MTDHTHRALLAAIDSGDRTAIKHLVSFSGGVGSWAAAKRVVERHGTEGVVLLFADTLIEDEDLYRFITEAAENVGAPLVRIADGRTPWEVFFDERYLGNSRVDPCSKILKRKLIDKWRDEHCDPETSTHYVGIDWSEMHRFTRKPGTRSENDPGGLKERTAAQGWRYEAPMCDRPWMTKGGMLNWLRREGIKPPRVYEMGFAHNNCGTFCVKAGLAQFAHMLKHFPERYREHEAKEEEFREFIGKDVSILTEQRDGEKRNITMRQLRERIESSPQQTFDFDDWGGCGCAIE